MRFFHLSIFALLAITAPQVADSSWGVAGCFPPPASGPVGPGTPMVIRPVPELSTIPGEFSWKLPTAADDPYLYLRKGTQQIGVYDRIKDNYRPLLDYASGAFGAPCEPPYPPPPELRKRMEPWMLQGVVEDKVCKDREVFTINGREVVQDRPFGDGLPDDSGKNWLVVIGGTPEIRSKVLSDWNGLPDLAGLRDKTHVWSGPADHLHMIDHRAKQPLYHTKGNPTIYFMNSGGEVLHRQDDYRGPADLQALRKIDPNYNPAKDPDLRKGEQPNSPLSVAKKIPSWIWVGLLAVAGFLVLRRLPDPGAA